MTDAEFSSRPRRRQSALGLSNSCQYAAPVRSVPSVSGNEQTRIAFAEAQEQLAKQCEDWREVGEAVKDEEEEWVVAKAEWRSQPEAERHRPVERSATVIIKNNMAAAARGSEEDGTSRMSTEDAAMVFTKSAFHSYITGDTSNSDTSSSQSGFRRSHLLHLWRRAPLVNHNYDALGEPFIFSPDSKVMIVWGSIMIYSVCWTVIMAPFEIAIVDVWQSITVVDWIVTFFFFWDIPMNFFVAMERRSTSGVRMVFEHAAITPKYLRGWFVWDVLCALPLDSIHSSNYDRRYQAPLRVMRLIRLIRLVKLKRSNLLSRIDLPYTVVTVMKCCVLSILCAHWIACIWAAMTSVQAVGRFTWLDAVIQTKLDLHEDAIHPMYIYMWSLYYSMSLITTVGFGDVTPQTDLECAVCTCGVVIGSVLWAYILSSLLDVLNRMNPHRMDFESTMDELNRMMNDHSLPDALRSDVRHYFNECEDLWRLQRRSDLIARMSRSLKGRVTLALNGEWIEKVVYIRSLFIKGVPGSTGFVVDISRKMLPKIFSPGEKLASPVLYIVRKGLIAAGQRLLGVGDVCGEDLLLDNPNNRSPFQLVALTMSGTLALSRASFLAALEKFPRQRKAVREYLIWLAAKRGMARELRILAGQSTPFIPTRGSFLRQVGGLSEENAPRKSTLDSNVDRDMDIVPQVATVADLSAGMLRLEKLMENQKASVTDMIEQHVFRKAEMQRVSLQGATGLSSVNIRGSAGVVSFPTALVETREFKIRDSRTSAGSRASERSSSQPFLPAVTNASWDRTASNATTNSDRRYLDPAAYGVRGRDSSGSKERVDPWTHSSPLFQSE